MGEDASAASGTGGLERTRLAYTLAGAFGGCVAGPAVDIVLYPIDTVKTRLQSAQGFFKAGGFKGVYRGLSSAALGSAPAAACFFASYEGTKAIMAGFVPDDYAVVREMTAGSVAEMTTAVVRMPFEVVKQQLQAHVHPTTSACVSHILKTKGLPGFWEGYVSLVMREIPFSFIQFPLYESLKRGVARLEKVEVKDLPAWQGSVCGSIAGGISAAVTTPLDVVKTRIILQQNTDNVPRALVHIYQREGIKALFAGVLPRTAFIALGGAIFFGAFEKARKVYWTLHDKFA
ncbi:hypothetical protein PTSG_02054 [Salpingoeca rosetta]|uniref:S-adenosylmethionine mitochondrial carrier protein n=1 Tax=Salpingoeca rosetta (strain ATCC 50818 / BSB-021) TaxID=946362 RepID=F2TZR3_SALR5|nr:uncharacterized protein PTSG_02054 [Salpingoeca rosetta]EGD79087.1 hypothetical protein PTSG_02054 [Salpingoeca rosetta]|eukprot:XP_004998043.1 hypothetical protein PTSG_02054 [Salpingoeca rosetta]